MAQLVDIDTGDLTNSYRYDPFGRLISAEGIAVAANPFKFSTRYFDGESGLYYYGYRYYSTEMGRWINRDPIGENGGLNLYIFIENTMITFDILGLKGPGHHIIPWEFFGKGQVSDVVKRIWDSPAARIWNKAYNSHNGKALGGISHDLYNKLVKAELDKFIAAEKTTLKCLTEEQAIRFLKIIRNMPPKSGIALFLRGVEKEAAQALNKVTVKYILKRGGKVIKIGTKIFGIILGVAIELVDAKETGGKDYTELKGSVNDYWSTPEELGQVTYPD